MPTQGILNGTALLVQDDTYGTLIGVGYATSCSISISHETRSTTNSTSGGWQTRMVGNRDWEVTCDAMVSMNDNPVNPNNANFYTYYSWYIDTRQKLLLRIGVDNPQLNDKYYEGYAYLTGMEINGSNQETATYSMTFIAAGPLTLNLYP